MALSKALLTLSLLATVSGHADYVAKPAIDNTHLQHVNVGDNVTMECTVTVHLFTKYKLEWIIPNMSDRIIVGDIESQPPMMPGHCLSTGKIKLTIVNAVLEDMGNYTCKVTDHAKNTNSQTIYLKIFERNEAYINLTVNGNITVAAVEEGQDFKWVINVEAHPKPSFTWSTNSTEIKNSSRIFVTSSPDMKQSILEIKRVTIQDSGDYEMEATNRNFSKELKLKLIVLGKPHVYMPSYPLKFFHGSSQQVNCTILGRPSPNVTWFLQPDGYKKKKISTEHFKNYVVSEEEGYKTVSELELKARASGTLECLAANKYGSDTEKTQVVIVGVEDIYEPVWCAYQCLESFLLPIYTNKIGLNSETQSRSSETAGEETVDEAEETENYNSLAGTSTPASTVSSPFTSNFKEKSCRGTASNIAEQQMATAFGQLTNVLSQRQSCANAEEDECDLYGKLLAKKMRELPEDDRKLMMYEIDGLFIKRIKQRLFSRETPSP